METFLYENGIDAYKLLITKAEHSEEISESDAKNFDVYEQASQIVKDVLTTFVYKKEADYELAGFTKKWFSSTLIEVTTFNFKHRMQSNRWGTIASDIHATLIGKSRYQVTGLSYKVKKGHSNVYLKTNWEQPPTDEITDEITNAINAYLQLPEVQAEMKNDPYTIKLLLKNEEAFISITN